VTYQNYTNKNFVFLEIILKQANMPFTKDKEFKLLNLYGFSRRVRASL